MNTPLSSMKRRSHGFTMLEVLISIVVIAFGMLGVAGLQAFALKNSQSASYRSVATVLANDLVDRMRANPDGVNGNFYTTGTALGTVAKVDSCLQAAGCPAASDLASNDLFEWTGMIASSLPRGAGVNCRDSSPNDGQPGGAQCDGTGPYVIKIWWIDDRNKRDASIASQTFRFATEFQP